MTTIQNIQVKNSGVWATAARGNDSFDVMLSTQLPRWNAINSGTFIEMSGITVIIYMDDDSQQQSAVFTRMLDGVIFGKTICPNGDFTEEHDIPASIIVRIDQ